MRILWLYQYLADYNFDHWLHLSYVRAVRDYNYADIVAYGPQLRPDYQDLAPIEYNPNLTMEQLHEKLKFDVVIVNTKSRCFYHYNPKKDEAEGMWLPPGFAEWKKTPKVMIEEDYHYEKNDLWYQEMNFDLIMQRHYSQSLRQEKVPMMFFPFSVDPFSFNDNRKYARIPKLALIGSSADIAYDYRRAASNILQRFGFAEIFSGAKFKDGFYTDALQRYIGYISCGSTYEITAAKNFEIMASGGVLFTNLFKGIELVFPPGSYAHYWNDCAHIGETAYKILFDEDYRKGIINTGKQCIAQRHTHEIRTREMLQIFKEKFGI